MKDIIEDLGSRDINIEPHKCAYLSSLALLALAPFPI